MSSERITDNEKRLSKALAVIVQRDSRMAECCIGLALSARVLGKTNAALDYIEKNPSSYTYEGVCEVVYKGVSPLEIVDGE